MQEGISVREAAGILGTTERAVRFRLSRKTLEGTRIDGRWFVYLKEDDRKRHGNGALTVQGSTVIPEWFRNVMEEAVTQAEEIGRLKAENDALHRLLESYENSEAPRGFWGWLRGK